MAAAPDDSTPQALSLILCAACPQIGISSIWQHVGLRCGWLSRTTRFTGDGLIDATNCHRGFYGLRSEIMKNRYITAVVGRFIMLGNMTPPRMRGRRTNRPASGGSRHAGPSSAGRQ